MERVTRDCQEDRPHIPLDPYPVQLLTDPDAALIRAVGTENEGHWAGTIAAPVTYVVDPNGKVKWAYTSVSASDRPSPVALAKAAVAIASCKEPPAEYPEKHDPAGRRLIGPLQLSRRLFRGQTFILLRRIPRSLLRG